MSSYNNDDRHSGPPDPYPLIGHTYHFLSDPRGFYASCRGAEKGIVKAEVGPHTFHYITSPELINEIFFEREDQFRKSEWLQENMREFWGDSISVRNGEQWRKQRERLQPVFELSRVKSHAETIVQETQSRMEQWERGEICHIDQEMEQISLRILSSFLFGTTLDPSREQRIIEASRDLTSKFDLSSISSLLPRWIPVSTNRKCNRAFDTLETEVDAILQVRKEQWESASGDEPTDVVTRLVVAMENGSTDVTEEVVKDEILTFLFEHRTLAVHLSYTLHLLAEYPETGSRLQEELKDELGDRPPEFTDLRNLPYLENVVKESLRVFPPVHTMFRQPTQPLKLGDEHLDQDSVLAVSPFIIHRDGNVYEEPDTFNPSRWSGESAEEIPHYAFFPFGGGARHCIGMRVANMSAQLIVGTIAQQYDISSVGHELGTQKFSVTLEPENGIVVKLS